MTDPARMDVLRQIPPLMPQFLQRRRLGLPVVSELAAQLGIDRPLLFMLVHIVTTGWIYDRDEVTLADLRAYDPYSAIDSISPRLEQLKEKGLVRETSDGGYTLSPEARATVDTLHTEA